MIKAGVSLQQNIEDVKEAAKIAVQEAIVQLDGHKPDILFLFSSIKYNQEKLFEGVKDEARGAPIVGASAAGEIASWSSVSGAVSAMAIFVRSDEVQR